MAKKSPTPRPNTRAASAHAPRAFEEVDDRITIPLAASASAATPNATLVSGINKYRSLSRSATASASSAPSTASASVHATFKSGLVAAVRQHNQSHQPSHPSALAMPQERAQALVDRKQFAAALPLYSEALAATASAQTKLKLFFQRGVCALSAHKYKLAVEDLTYVIDLTPSNAMLLAKRAKAHAALLQFPQALRDYDAAIAMTPPSQAELRGLLMARAAVHAHMGSVGAAFEDLAVAQKDTLGGERDAELFYQRAQLRLQCRQHALAVDDLDRFLELQETSLDWTTREDEPQEDERQEEQEDVRRRVVDVRMEHAALLMRLAREAEERRRADDKILAVEQGEKQPLLGHVHSGRDYQTSSVPVKGKRRRPAAAMLKGGDGAKSPVRPSEKKAARLLQDGLSYRDGDALGLVERAARDYTQVLASDPHHVDALRLRGDALAKLGQVDSALRDYDAALAIDKHDFQVQVAKAKLLFAQREASRAIAELTLVLQLNGFFVDALFLRAEMYEAQGELEHAKSDYTSIINATLDKKDAASDAAVMSEKSKKHAAASTTLAPAAKFTNEYATQALLLRARVAQRMHDYEAAARDYERILESCPNDVEAQYELQENNEKKEQYEKQRELDALAWLEEKEQEEEEQRGGTGGAGTGASGAANGGKKKKKKSKKKKSAAGGSAGTPTASVTTAGDDEERGAEESEAQDDAGRREGGAKAATRIEDAGEDAESSAFAKKVSLVSIVVTRDEACESMWEEQTVDELELLPLAAQLQRTRGTSPRDLFPILIDSDSADDKDDDKVRTDKRKAEDEEERMQLTATDDDEEPDVEEPTPLEIPPIDTTHEDMAEKAADASPVDSGDGAGGSPTSASTPSHVTIRERLVDERYLRKRQKQLDKLRSQLLEACEARDRDVLEEAMARAERKLMTEPLEEEIAQAKRVVLEIEDERRRAEEERLKQERYRQQELERARRKKERELAAEKQKEQQQQQREEDPGKPTTPSLVIRPIAYGQALHVAEQHQQQLLQYQRLLQEKDAEIAYLKSLLSSQGLGEVVPETESEHGGTLSVVALLQRPSESLKAARTRMDTLIEWMGPSADADDARFRILSFVRRVVERHWSQTSMAAPLLFVATGSFPMKTYLPTADLDVCLFLPKELEPTWHFTVLNALCMAGHGATDEAAPVNGSPDAKLASNGVAPVGSGAASASAPPGSVPASASGAVASSAAASPLSTHTVRNVSFINAEVRVVKCTIDNVSVDVTANRVGALGALLLLDAMDQRAGRDHLLKRSVILIKSWCFHESSSYLSASTPTQRTQSTLLGASHGALSTYAINTIVMSLFNSHGSSIVHPLDALLLFLDKMATFPWHESALTLFGPVPLSLLATSGSLAAALHKLHKRQPHRLSESMALMTIDDVDALRRHVHDQFGALEPSVPPASGSGVKTFPMRACNVVDPLDDANNLARSVSLEAFPTMKRAFSSGRDRLTALLSEQQASESTSTSVDAFFATCWRVYGRGDGWRPDLLIHPRQTWHARAPVAAMTEKTKWQSLLPEFLLSAAPLGTAFHQHQHQHLTPLHPLGLPLHPLAYHPPPPHHQRHYYQHQHQHQHQHVPNGGSGSNGGHFHGSPGHYGGSRGAAGRYYDGGGGVRSSASSSSSPLSSSPTPSHYKSPPRRTQSLPGTGSAVSLVAAAASSVYTNGYEPQPRGSHKGGHARRYDSPPTTTTSATSASASTSSSPATTKTPPRNPKREL